MLNSDFPFSQKLGLYPDEKSLISDAFRALFEIKPELKIEVAVDMYKKGKRCKVDSGQVGRGNRVNGIIPLNRPVSSEAAAGKNPVSHVGKIYNMLSQRIANEICVNVPNIREVYVWLLSQIGEPIDLPKIASTKK